MTILLDSTSWTRRSKASRAPVRRVRSRPSFLPKSAKLNQQPLPIVQNAARHGLPPNQHQASNLICKPMGIPEAK